MKHLTAEQNKTWNKYYSWLDADRLLFVITNSLYYGKPSGYKIVFNKAKGWNFARPVEPVNYRQVTGAIWRDQKTHNQISEPIEVENKKLPILLLTKALEIYQNRLYGEGKKYSFDLNRAIKQKRRVDFAKCYIAYHPLLIKRIQQLTEPLLYGQREDIQQLVKEYQGGNRELLTRIKNQLGGLIYKANNEFSYIGKKEAFTNLAGKFNKKIPKPDIRYSDASPMGDSDNQRLMLITEPFIFDENDLQLTIDKSLLEALASYKPDKGAKFKTWFYRIFQSDLIDLYRNYQNGWKHGYTIKTLEEFKEKLQQKLSPKIDFTEAAELIPAAIMKELTLQQKRWIALFLKMLPDRLTKQLTADILGISESAEYSIRQQLQIAYIKHTNNVKIKALIE